MRIPIAAVPIALALTVMVGGGVASAHSSRSSAAPFKYVALGDSYSAGEGVDPYFRDGFNRATGRQGGVDNRCHRSSRAYATWVRRSEDAGRTLYAVASGGGKPGRLGGKNTYGSDKNVRSAGGVQWASWACSGALTKNVLPASLGGVPQRDAGQTYDRRTQLDSADLTGADLVTITIGGNDIGFADGLVYCALLDCNTAAYQKARAKIIDDTKPLLVKVYRAIATKAPGARILVLGYPQLFPATHVEQSCGELSLFKGEQDVLRGLAAHLNDTIEAAVGAVRNGGAKIEFVPVAHRFAGHEVCGSKGPWINGIDTTPKDNRKGADDGSFHPTLKGQQDGYAAAVNATLTTKGSRSKGR